MSASKKKYSLQYCQHGGIQQQDNEFCEALRNLLDVIFESPCDRVIWSSLAMFLTLATCSLSDLQKQPSTAEHQSRSRSNKLWWYARYLRNFDRLLKLSGHCLRCFWRRHVCHLSDLFGRRQHESVATVVAISHGISVTTACISRNTNNFTCSLRRPFSIVSFRHFTICIIPTPPPDTDCN